MGLFGGRAALPVQPFAARRFNQRHAGRLPKRAKIMAGERASQAVR
jgi:hypothetical protein